MNNQYDQNGQQQQPPPPYQQQQQQYQQPYYYQQPYPQQPKKKHMSNSTFLTIIILLIALVFILNGFAKRAGIDVFNSGDKVKETTVAQLLKMKTSGITETDHIGVSFADDGKTLLVINYSIVNDSEKEMDYWDRHFTLITPSGTKLEPRNHKLNDISSVESGGRLSDEIVFEIPESMTGNFTLVYETYVVGQKGEATFTRK